MATELTRNKTNTQVQYQRPLSLSPWSKNAGMKEGGGVWISMKPSKIVDQYSKGAGTISTIDLKTEFIFLAPLNLNENIVHHWEAYESVSSRLAQKARSAIKLGNEAAALKGVFDKAATSENVKKIISGNISKEALSIENVATAAYNAVGGNRGSRIPNIKIDTPLYYTNSDRRQIVFEFQLFNESVRGYDTRKILIEPIQELMKYSSPNLITDIQIEFPYMWEVKTLPENFIYYKTCALVGVQPTWNSPYVNHFPSSCNLQLTFTDLSPLYASTIEKGSVVNVVTQTSNQRGSTTTMSATNGVIYKKN